MMRVTQMKRRIGIYNIIFVVFVILFATLSLIGQPWIISGFNSRPKVFVVRTTVIKDLLHWVESISSRAATETKLSRFLYLVQTEGCLPPKLNSLEVIGHSSTCQCDVLVLSYKQKCNDESSEHITYIFNPSVSWNAGRNLLFETARQRKNEYFYYTFVDDDMTLTLERKSQNPWRLFEYFLKQTEPAVAAVRIKDLWICDLKAMYKSRRRFGCSLTTEVDNLPTPFFDPAINAFHHQAVKHILPHTTRFDDVSWWWSGWYAAIKSEVMFPGQVVVHTELIGINNKHRPYPKTSPDSTTDWLAIVNEARIDLPERYQNATLLDEWLQDGPLGHFYKSSSLCLPPPRPYMLIHPFAYLEHTNDHD